MTSKNCLALKESRQPLSQDNLITYIKGISLISLRIPLNMVSQEEIVKKKNLKYSSFNMEFSYMGEENPPNLNR